MCPSPPWFHHPERRLLAGFLGLLWSVLAGGCATTSAPVAPDTIEEVSAAPVPEAPEYIPVVRYGRYTLVELAPTAAQRDLLLTMTYAVLPSLRLQPALAATWAPRILSEHYDPRLAPAHLAARHRDRRALQGRPGGGGAAVAPDHVLLVVGGVGGVGGRIGKKAGFVAASLLLALGAVLVYLLHAQGVAAVGAALTLVGIGYAGAQMFPMAMLPDAAAVDAQRTGENRVGVYTGVWTAGETLGLALGPGVYALVLTLGGYVSSTDGLAAQPDSAVTAMTLGFTLLPAALALLALIPLRSYRIDAAAVAAATEEAR